MTDSSGGSGSQGSPGPGEKSLEVTCPCCRTVLTVDASSGLVLHEKRHRGPTRSFEEAVAAERDRGKEIDSAFRKAFTDVEHEKETLEKKLRAAMKKAKEEKDKPPPLRPIDLD